MTGNVRWKLSRGAGQQVDVETTFLMKICHVVERMVDEEWRLVRLMKIDVVSAGVANCFINAAVANAALRVHAAIHRHLASRDTGQLTAADDWTATVDQLRGDPTFDLRLLAEVRRLAFDAQLQQATGIDDCRPPVMWQLERLGSSKMISDEVDRVVKHHSDTVRENMDNCNVLTLARLGAALQRQDHAHSAASQQAVMDTLADQLWTSAVDAASSRLLSEQLTTSTTQADDRLRLWLSQLSQSTLTKVLTARCVSSEL